MLPAQHWSKRWIWGDGDNNRSLWGSFLIEYKGKKIFFACDTGPAPFYKELGEKFGPIDLSFGNIGAYNFFPIVPFKDKSTAHTNPEELLSLMKDLKVKKVVGMHWGTSILSLEPIWEPPVRFKANAGKFGYKNPIMNIIGVNYLRRAQYIYPDDLRFKNTQVYVRNNLAKKGDLKIGDIAPNIKLFDLEAKEVYLYDILNGEKPSLIIASSES